MVMEIMKSTYSKSQKGKTNVVNLEDVRGDVVGHCECCGEEISSTDDRWMELQAHTDHFMENHKPLCSCVHDVHKYKSDQFPKDNPQIVIEGMENYVPRSVLDVSLVDTILEKYPDDQHEEYLKRTFRKYDAIYGKAHKQWLRYLMNECREHGLLDEGGGDEDIVT